MESNNKGGYATRGLSFFFKKQQYCLLSLDIFLREKAQLTAVKSFITLATGHW
jgi:hypothetical protein